MKEFYKILHENQKHFEMQYHLGLNEDVEPFDETSDCRGGIFFSDKEHVLDYLIDDYGTKLAIIEIPEGEKIIQVEDTYKAHQINIKEIKDLWSEENYEWLTSYFEINELFQYACTNGALSFAKKLEKNYKLNIHVDGDSTFLYTCEIGHLKVAKWLYSFGSINIHVYEDAAFRGACENGYLEVAQWLHSLGGVDIHVYNDEAFRWSCENGHLKVAQWLHSLGGVDIHVMDDYAFRHSPEEIINWLNTL